ncbi:MAG: hypothetical protein Q4D62_14295 [Planctomycetia bacterium]|nr:hypothetical protein [Planctomycetia bacterium]
MKSDKVYMDILLSPIKQSIYYLPKFGQGGKNGLSLEDFQKLYQGDIFYTWLGLDSPLMYAAHRVAGGMTSIYRQIGKGSENLFRAILQDELELSSQQVHWSYIIEMDNSSRRKLSLDGRIVFKDVLDKVKRSRIQNWVRNMGRMLQIEAKILSCLQGVVFEVRQGYKSKDSKRQNADIANASKAYTQAYLPCVMVMSNQIDIDIVHRYRLNNWAILTGDIYGSHETSIYTFMKEIIGYDLAGFFQRNTDELKNEVAKVLLSLLSINQE